MGNEEAKKLMCMTHGHELSRENAGGMGQGRAEGNEGEKKMGQL